MNISISEKELQQVIEQAIFRNNGIDHDKMKDTLINLLIELFPDREFSLDESVNIEKIIELLIKFSTTTAASSTLLILSLLGQKALDLNENP